MHRTWRLTLLWTLGVLLGTLHPFVLDPWVVTVPSDSFWIPRLKGLDPPFNVLMFMPLGWALRQRGRGLGWAVGSGLVFSAGIELAQHFVPFRVPVAEDIFFNGLGAGLGWVWAAPITRALALLRPGLRASLAGLLAAFILWAAAPPEVKGSLWLWSYDSALVVGQERSGVYPWHGQVHRAQMWVGNSTRSAPAWDLQVHGPGVFEDLAAQIDEAQTFVLQTVLTGPPTPTPEDDLQRILVWSQGVQNRNFLLGQAVDVMVFRLRTRVTPLVGQFPDRSEPLQMPAIAEGQTSTVTISYDAGRLWGQVDDQRYEGTLEALPQHNGARRFWLPKGQRGSTLFSFCAGLVIAAALGGWQSRRRAFLGGLTLALVTMLVQTVLLDAGLPALGLLGACAGAAFGAWATSRSAAQGPAPM